MFMDLVRPNNFRIYRIVPSFFCELIYCLDTFLELYIISALIETPNGKIDPEIIIFFHQK